MKIQMIKNRYRLPFNPNKPISFLWDGLTRIGNIITVYVVIETKTHSVNVDKYYYSITIADDIGLYFIIRHIPRKLFHGDNKLRVEQEFEYYGEAKTHIDKRISGWKGGNDTLILVDIIDVKE